MKSTDPLYLLYTSGQGISNKPRPIVRDTGGTCLALNWAMENIFDIGKKDTMFCTSDLGWVAG